MFALGTIWHGEDEVQVDIKFYRDIKRGDGELVVSRRDLRSTGSRLAHGALNTLGLMDVSFVNINLDRSLLTLKSVLACKLLFRFFGWKEFLQSKPPNFIPP